MKMILSFSGFLFSLLFVFSANAQMQKIVGDCTVTYSVISQNNSLGKTVKILYVRGNQSRVDLQSDAFSQSVIYNDNTGEAVILRELGGEKYISNLTAAKWKRQNEKYAGMIITDANEAKIIAGYNCKKIKVALKDGSVFSLFYTPQIMPSCSENPYQFRNVPGLVLEYETQTENKQTITFLAKSIDFNPVPHYKFEIPTDDYRILEEKTY